TPNGLVKVENLNIGDYIYTVNGSHPIKEIEKHNNVQVFKVCLSDGGEFIATAAHRVHSRKASNIKNPNKKVVEHRHDELEIGDQVRVHKMAMPNNIVLDKPDNFTNREYGLFIGMLIGDGCYTEKMLE